MPQVIPQMKNSHSDSEEREREEHTCPTCGHDDRDDAREPEFDSQQDHDDYYDDCYECTDECEEVILYEANSLTLFGCTDPNALNYSTMYTDNDGSCIYGGENIGDYCLHMSSYGSNIGKYDCNMDCGWYSSEIEGDGYCDSRFNCAEFNYDGGDCGGMAKESSNSEPNTEKKENENKLNNRGFFKFW